MIRKRAGENADWELLRVNLVHDDRDRLDGYDRSFHGWQPRWHRSDNVVGSDMFRR